MAKKIFILAGETSGDLHGSNLMKKILEKEPDTQFIGIGGSEMQSLGLESIVDLKEISVIGFYEVAKKYGFFKNLLNKCQQIMESEKPDVFVPIDYPGFNLRLARFAKSKDIPVIYYIAPQLWAWGKNRTENLRKNVDKLLVVFPFEERFFSNADIDAEFVGHPLLDIPKFKDQHLEKDNDLIALLPGSRNQEIKKHLELFSQTTLSLPDNYRLGLAIPKNTNIDLFANLDPRIELWEDSHDLMSKAKAGIVKSGTSNLEACFLNMPFVMVYKTSFFTYQLAKQLINIDYLSIVNILSNKTIIKELIQNDAKEDKIASELNLLLQGAKKYKKIQTHYKNIKSKLSEKSASESASSIILNFN